MISPLHLFGHRLNCDPFLQTAQFIFPGNEEVRPTSGSVELTAGTEVSWLGFIRVLGKAAIKYIKYITVDILFSKPPSSLGMYTSGYQKALYKIIRL